MARKLVDGNVKFGSALAIRHTIRKSAASSKVYGHRRISLSGFSRIIASTSGPTKDGIRIYFSPKKLVFIIAQYGKYFSWETHRVIDGEELKCQTITRIKILNFLLVNSNIPFVNIDTLSAREW